MTKKKTKKTLFRKMFDAYVTIVGLASIFAFEAACMAALCGNAQLKNQILIGIIAATLSVPAIAFIKACYDEVVDRRRAVIRRSAKAHRPANANDLAA